MALNTLPYKYKITSNVSDGIGGITVNMQVLNGSNALIATTVCYVNEESSWPEIESKLREAVQIQMEKDAGTTKISLLNALVNKNISL